jgi:hypothetical protein
MALDALVTALMPSVFDTHKLASGTVGIFEKRVTPEAKLSGFVERQKLFVVRMIYGWAVTVFTFDRRVC